MVIRKPLIIAIKGGLVIRLLLLVIFDTDNLIDCRNLTTTGHREWSMRIRDVISVSDRDTNVGYILSPNYPEPAPTNSISIATLHATDSGNESRFDVIKLSFEEFHLQMANNCQGESLNIYLVDQSEYVLDPDRLIYTFCGSRRLEPLMIYGRNIVVQYIKDEFIAPDWRNRFRLKFEFLNSKLQLYNGCEQPHQFRCMNRKCISIELVCNRFDDCGDATDEDRCSDRPSIPYKIDYKCGLASFGNSLGGQLSNPESQLENRIVGGSQAKINNRRLPQASIQYIGIEPMSHNCGGTLIHPKFVLTSAHCLRSELEARNYKIVFGLQDLRENYDVDDGDGGSSIQVRYANRISMYTYFLYTFSEMERANNIALIELNAPVQLTAHVWPACLPHLAEPIEAGRECVATGFGETRGSGLAHSLKQVIQTIKHGSECRSQYSDFKNDDYTMICVDNDSANGPCRGDSGGPLLCRDDSEGGEDSTNFRSVDVSEPERSTLDDLPRVERGNDGEVIKFLELEISEYNSELARGRQSKDDSQTKWTRRATNRHAQSRYTVYGVTSFTTDGNLGGGYCGMRGVPTIYGRVSTRIEWILWVMKLALPRLSIEDNSQDVSRLFGYMFRTGHSQHPNFTRQMTMKNVEQRN